MARRIGTFIALSIALGIGAAVADDTSPPIAYAPVIEKAVKTIVIPAYTRLVETAAGTESAVAHLCAGPDDERLEEARARYAELAGAWSSVEMFRIGPARAENRYERLFFWPDRKGLGLRQVQAIIADEDTSAAEVTSLRGKSVAVQGLPALEFVLFGTGSETLADTASAESFRCRYGSAIAGAIHRTAAEINEGWTAEGGYADVMGKPGMDNPVYRTHGEAVQDLLRAAREQLQLVRDVKIARSLRKSPAAAIPRQAPFWRSDMTLSNMRGNLAAVETLINDSGIAGILPAESAWLGPSLLLAIRAADTALEDAANAGLTWEDAVRDPALFEKLTYALIPLADAIALLETRFPAAFGLTTGFNTLDGD